MITCLFLFKAQKLICKKRPISKSIGLESRFLALATQPEVFKKFCATCRMWEKTHFDFYYKKYKL